MLPLHQFPILYLKNKRGNRTNIAQLFNKMAEVVGFEPTNVGVKVPCLTAWLHLNIKQDTFKESRFSSRPRLPLRQ